MDIVAEDGGVDSDNFDDVSEDEVFTLSIVVEFSTLLGDRLRPGPPSGVD